MRVSVLAALAAAMALVGCGSSNSSSSSSGSTGGSTTTTTTTTTTSSSTSSTSTSSSSTGGSSGSTSSSSSSSSGSTGSGSTSGSSGSGSGSSGSTGANLCANYPQPCVAFVSGVDDENSINAGMATATDGTTFVFSAGSFTFQNSLNVPQAMNNITLVGAGMGQTTLDFSNQVAGSDGIDVIGGTGITFQGLTVLNAAQNAIKVLNSTNVIFEAVETTWTNVADPNNGPYGVYPVGVTNVLIEGCHIVGASDSGVYVGQSNNIVVRSNVVEGNVAGIEIENSFNADVYNNNTHDNTAGLLVFDLPNLQQQGGHDVRLFNNTVVNNNTSNFGRSGDIVSIVPAGSGVILMANHNDEVFGNTITGNHTAAIGVISYYVSQIPVTDPNYYPFPYNDAIHDNFVDGNGAAPSANPAQPIGFLLANANTNHQFTGGHVVDELYDGILDPNFPTDVGFTLPLPDAGIDTTNNPMVICFSNNGGDGGAATFGNLHLDQLQIYVQFPDGGFNPGWDGGPASNVGDIVSQDETPYSCVLPAVTSQAGGWLDDGGP
ncbi:MAG: right-handed parallel beta-helix repeat-containing protein [Deltaproteobacteria bacterium]|nr:right-handed parallel beta-helix repeat-containing protein [Deltaproteobacteria bacterium]